VGRAFGVSHPAGACQKKNIVLNIYHKHHNKLLHNFRSELILETKDKERRE
jgi:hypothetical protein